MYRRKRVKVLPTYYYYYYYYLLILKKHYVYYKSSTSRWCYLPNCCCITLYLVLLRSGPQRRRLINRIEVVLRAIIFERYRRMKYSWNFDIFFEILRPQSARGRTNFYRPRRIT